MRTVLTILSVVSALAVTGCTDLAGEGTTPVPGNYLVRSVDDMPMPEGVTFALHADGRFSGHGPCNDFRGTSSAALPGFQADAFASTRKTCDGNTMRFEKAYFNAITSADSITGGIGGIRLSNNASGEDMKTVTLLREPVRAR